MQTFRKNPNQSNSHPVGFKKKELKKKITECLHICQCGRQFLSFPAVYSHAKTKHNFKISSRVGDQGRKIVEKESQTKIYYQINNSQLLQDKMESQSEIKNSQNPLKVKQNTSKFNFINKIKKLQTSDNKKNIYAILVEFLNQSSNQYTLQAMNFTSEILDLLTTCINEHYMHYDNSKIYRDYCSDNTCETLPCYFNFFLIWYLPSKGYQIIENYQKVFTLLKIVFVWLRNNQYTTQDFENSSEQNDDNDCKNFFLKNKESSVEEKQQTMAKKQPQYQYQEES